MRMESRVSLGWPSMMAAAFVLVALGAVGAYVVIPSGGPSAFSARDSDTASSAAASELLPASALEESSPGPAPTQQTVEVTLTNEVVERAGIVVVPVAADGGSEGLRAPGVVEANAYRQVAVTPLVAGRVTAVGVELGQAVQRGQMVAQIFSPELAEAETRYVSARATLGAHEQELARTEQLVAIGAVSRQDLERIQAEHAARRADLESAEARLHLLGFSAAAVTAIASGNDQGTSLDVPAPITGVVTERAANVGLNVTPTSPLLTVTDLSTVWIVVDIYERDFRHVTVGSPAQVTTHAYPDETFEGRVSYIDPRVSPETRTAKARIEVPNRRGELRLGMYAEAIFRSRGGESMPMVPRAAVQHVGDRTVVYLADVSKPATFIEREVRLGAAVGDHWQVLSGIQTGDSVVSEGSFSVRAERERLGLREKSATSPAVPATQKEAASQGPEDIQEATIVVGDASFEPSRLTLHANVLARLTFTRTSATTCATSVVFPALKITKALPINEPVSLEFTPRRAGELAFACGMNMLRGTIVIR
jgi:cobalt-zinc-cadmium efflux system membrane fusion protein